MEYWPFPKAEDGSLCKTVLSSFKPLQQQLNEESTITLRKPRFPGDTSPPALPAKAGDPYCQAEQELQANAGCPSRTGSPPAGAESPSTSLSSKIKTFSEPSSSLKEGKSGDHSSSQVSARRFQTFSKVRVRLDLRSAQRLYSVPQYSDIYFVSYPAFTEETP